MKKTISPKVLVRRTALCIAVLAGFVVHIEHVRAQPAFIAIQDARAFPESLTSSADGTIILGSLDHGTIYRAAPGMDKATPWIDASANHLMRVLGVFSDDKSNLLWVCNNDPDPNVNKAELRTFDLKTGAAKGTYPFPDGGLCNDIAVTADGAALATDTRGGRILRLRQGAAALEVWGADEKWKGIDGIAILQGGAVLFNNVRQHQLVRIVVGPDGAAGAVTFLELSQPVLAPDGMRSLPDGRVILAENQAGKIDLVRVEGDKAQIETIKDGFKLSSTSVTVVGKTAWVIETKFAYRNDPTLKDKDPGIFGATAVPLPER